MNGPETSRPSKVQEYNGRRVIPLFPDRTASSNVTSDRSISLTYAAGDGVVGSCSKVPLTHHPTRAKNGIRRILTEETPTVWGTMAFRLDKVPMVMEKECVQASSRQADPGGKSGVLLNAGMPQTGQTLACRANFFLPF